MPSLITLLMLVQACGGSGTDAVHEPAPAPYSGEAIEVHQFIVWSGPMPSFPGDAPRTCRDAVRIDLDQDCSGSKKYVCVRTPAPEDADDADVEHSSVIDTFALSPASCLDLKKLIFAAEPMRFAASYLCDSDTLCAPDAETLPLTFVVGSQRRTIRLDRSVRDRFPAGLTAIRAALEPLGFL